MWFTDLLTDLVSWPCRQISSSVSPWSLSLERWTSCQAWSHRSKPRGVLAACCWGPVLGKMTGAQVVECRSSISGNSITASEALITCFKNQHHQPRIIMTTGKMETGKSTCLKPPSISAFLLAEKGVYEFSIKKEVQAICCRIPFIFFTLDVTSN